MRCLVWLATAGLLCAGEIRVDFGDIPSGVYEPARMKQDWPGLRPHSTDRLRIVEDGDQRWLRVAYPKGATGALDSGAQFRATLPKPVRHASLSYRVRFGEPGQDSWDFSEGGKLPGLAGGLGNTGGDRPDGRGWSARYMWRRNGALFVYLYHLDQKGRYGDYLDLEYKAKPGRWIELRQQIIVNEGDHPNGLLRVWIDGKLHLQRKDLRFQLGDAAPVGEFHFSTFFGGDEPRWAPASAMTADFDDFHVSSPAAIEPHPQAIPSQHKLSEVDNPDLVPFIVGDPATLPGLVLDETDAELVGEWQYSTHTPPYVGIGYLHDRKAGKGEKSAMFRPRFEREGWHEVRLAHCANPRRATKVRVTVVHADGRAERIVNMQKPGEIGRLWISLGRFRFEKEGGSVVIENTGSEPDRVVIVDAVQFLPVDRSGPQR